MQTNNLGFVALLFILLFVLNRKDIADFIEWLHFKIKTYLKQRQNECNNNTDRG